MPRKARDPVVRFFENVDKSDGCWLWVGTIGRGGYGAFEVPGRWAQRAHRFSYELHVGPIPAGLVLDHLCRNRRCVNPEHLEPVTNRVNVMRGETLPAHNAAKTHCIRGHAFSASNTAMVRGARRCRACQRDIARARRKERAA